MLHGWLFLFISLEIGLNGMGDSQLPGVPARGIASLYSFDCCCNDKVLKIHNWRCVGRDMQIKTTS
jgi:hypothetical protein